MDLTRALVRGGDPYLPSHFWSALDESTAFWGNLGGSGSLVDIFEELSVMAHHVHCFDNTTELRNVDLIRRFEEKLQPPRRLVSVIDDKSEVMDVVEECRSAYSQSFVRSFRHCALVYLYRAICKLRTDHRLVQQQVHYFLEALSTLSRQENLQNCSLFPLCVSGALSLADAHREAVTTSLSRMRKDLGFGNVSWLQRSLEDLWHSGNQITDWQAMFMDSNEKIFIL